MKLYGTVTSERASKGQGGEYLDIELKNELKIVFASIKVRNQVIEIWHDGETEIKSFKDSAWNREIYEYQKTRGERQKGDRVNCVCTAACGAGFGHRICSKQHPHDGTCDTKLQ